jgi:serine/threonine protein phosphatase PrpC
MAVLNPDQATHGGQQRIISAGRSDVGMKRPHNEDSIEINESLNLYAVADGMGGHAAGEVASRTAIETLAAFIASASTDRDFTWPFGFDKKVGLAENVLLTGFQLANRKVCQLSADNEKYSGMGTTMASLYIPGRYVYVAHVGDSRVYRMREGELRQVTSDHSWVNEQLQRNIITEDEARNHRWRNVITRALGNRLDLEIDILCLEAVPGDAYLLCSDGLSGMVSDEAIAQIMFNGADDLESVTGALINAANEAGGQDNISAIVVKIAS